MDLDWTPLDPRARTVWRVTAALLASLPLVPLVVVAAVVSGAQGLVASLAAAVVICGIALAVVDRRWRAYAYAERDADLLVRRGVLFRRLSVVPYGRMQFVDVAQGPLQRACGLATVRLHTAAAASDAVLPGLAEDEAHRLRDRLAELGEARAAGL